MKQSRLIPVLACSALMLVGFAACSQAEETPAPAPAKAGGPQPAPDPVTLVSRPNATGGEKLYVEKCIMCHGANGMGYGLLARRAKGFEPDLEKRQDLAKAYIIMAARRGIGNMPAIPRGEVSDAELAQIADYLASHKGPSQ
ncbi:MAG: cytochrome c [Candidatus Andeanibacterium colombiense]|uniref:Cytochrome c n=1 Tax=Candidatus Andeanibacterium colombiense TaxID=3121345 RepID=A0AAJ6BM18_9SPHN|nr:MAG: cytochrome c [Sphingomonadaceae bacterium]